MSDTDTVLDRVEMREVAGVFRSRSALEDAVDALLRAGIDRADIDFLANADEVRSRLGTAFVPAEELADIPQAPRRPALTRTEVILALAIGAGVLTFAGAAAAALSVVASGGSTARAAV